MIPDPNNLGALSSPRDDRDIKLGSVQVPQPVPFSFRPDVSAISRYYQGSQPACGGHAGAWFKSYLDYLNLQLNVERSPRFIYSICKRDDGYPGEGTYLRQIMKTLTNVGACEMKFLPNDITLPKAEYINLNNIRLPAFEDAKQNKITAYVAVDDLSFSGLCQAIYKNQAVILLIWCDEGFFGTTTPTFTSKKYGHFVVGCQYDQANIYVIDSTEKDPNLALKAIPRSAVESGFVREAGTAMDLPNWQLVGLTSNNAIVRFILQRLIALYSKVKT